MIKPFDVGNGLVAASVCSCGALLSISRAHPLVGYVELVAGPQFPDSQRQSPSAVRSHRARMAERCEPIVAVVIDGPAWATRHNTSIKPPPTWAYGAVPRTESAGQGWRCETTTWPVDGRPAVRQHHSIHRTGRGRQQVGVRLRGRLDRPALGEITEGGPLPPTDAITNWTIATTPPTALARAAALPAAATISINTDTPVEWSTDGDGIDAIFEWDAAQDESLSVNVTLSLVNGNELTTGCPPTRDRTTIRGPRPELPPTAPTARHQQLLVPAGRDTGLSAITQRALHYIHGCTAVRTGTNETCIITDHRLLPVSWTRDAYWAALLLLAEGSPASIDVVERHLRWLFTRCQRPDGRWSRSHLPNGAPKDSAYAADQQLYPLLELADFHHVTSRLPSLEGMRHTWEALIAEAWAALRPIDGLLATRETPADDTADLPFLISTQILYWWTGRRLAALHPGAAKQVAAISDRIAEQFVVEGPFGAQWAYATDDRGRTLRYHDANDLPTALAPLWGFCPSQDTTWRATMSFAWSHHNAGYAQGSWGGLGSRHTPGTWSLGDLQEWIVASLTNDLSRTTRTIDRLIGAATPDSMLPEAYDPTTGRLTARHWFAWPGSTLGAFYLCGGTITQRQP